MSKFQVIFTGCETDDTDEPNVHGGAMWARMPITALVADTSYESGQRDADLCNTAVGLHVSRSLSLCIE